MGANKKKAGPSIPESLKKLVTDCPAESLDEKYFKMDWRKRGLCSSFEDPDIFFDAEQTGPTRITCNFCPVKQECLIWALMYNEEGLWGATTKEERKLFGKEYPEYVKSLTIAAKRFKWWFPLPSVKEILDLAGIRIFVR